MEVTKITDTFTGILNGGEMNPAMLMEILPMVAKAKPFIPKVLGLSKIAKEWEGRQGLEEGENIQYCALVKDDDAVIYVQAIKQIFPENLTEGSIAMEVRTLYRFVLTDLIAMVDQYIPNV